MKYLITIAVTLVLASCAASELKVDCDGKPQPINVSAPVVHPGKASP